MAFGDLSIAMTLLVTRLVIAAGPRDPRALREIVPEYPASALSFVVAALRAHASRRGPVDGRSIGPVHRHVQPGTVSVPAVFPFSMPVAARFRGTSKDAVRRGVEHE
jgi:hypothetical protein